MERFEEMCMMCYKTKKVRHINLYLVGSEGFLCCESCEYEILELIRKKRYKAVKRKRELFKNLKKKGGDKR